MKVRPSVKKICENCKIVRRRGVGHVICSDRVTSSARKNRRGSNMARIAGINIPMNKHVVIGLTHIFGVGDRARRRSAPPTGIKPTTKVKDLPRGRGQRDPL